MVSTLVIGIVCLQWLYLGCIMEQICSSIVITRILQCLGTSSPAENQEEVNEVTHIQGKMPLELPLKF